MTELGILKKRIAALSAAISEFEATVEEPAQSSVDLKDELSNLSLDELKDINAYVTELMLNKASGKKSERIGKRMPLAVKQNMVAKYLDAGQAAEDVKNEYLFIADIRPKDRTDDQKKKFMDLRNKAQKWYEANYSENQ